MIVQGMQNTMAYHQDGWVYIPPHKGKGYAVRVGNESGFSKQEQLYNLTTDVHQDKNLVGRLPEKISMMKAQLTKILAKSSR